jgi:hypothetical protein
VTVNRRASASSCAVVALCVVAAACTQRAITDRMLSGAYPRRALVATLDAPTHDGSSRSGYQLLRGDLHCHVAPPDDAGDVTRGFEETIALARQAGLDFVVLTPHVRSRFFADETERSAVASRLAALRVKIDAARAADSDGGVLFVAGFEYTDHAWGHVGVAFADLDAVLAEVPLAIAKTNPERFFEVWVARGGTLVVNHPLVTPLESAIPIARANLSWRPWTSTAVLPPEIAAVDRLAQAYEAYNVPATHLRDRWLLGDEGATLRGTLRHLDAQIVARGRPAVPVGGSDTHDHTLGATTFVLARARSIAGVHDAIVAGRTCVRDAAACSFEARAEGGAWVTVGGAIGGPIGHVDAIEARADGELDLYVDGTVVASAAAGEIVRAAVPADRCSAIRARVDEGWSAPIYVNCP